jgi:hypothetical protein
MTDLGTMLKQQMQNNIAQSLDSAVQAGDIQAARKAATSLIELEKATAAAAPAVKKPPTLDEVKKAVATKLPWFGIDPRKTEKLMALGRMMDPTRFDTPEAFADQLVKAYNDEDKKPARGAAAASDEDDENDENAEDDEDAENDENAEDDEDAEPKRGVRRERKNGTQQPELNNSRGGGATNLRTAFQTGDIKHLPRTAADEVRKSADKYARGGNERDNKLRAVFIKNAVMARARADLIAAGKFDPRTNTLKK